MQERMDLGMLAFQQAREAFLEGNSFAAVLEHEKLTEALKIAEENAAAVELEREKLAEAKKVVEDMKAAALSTAKLDRMTWNYDHSCALFKVSAINDARRIESLLAILSGDT